MLQLGISVRTDLKPQACTSCRRRSSLVLRAGAIAIGLVVALAAASSLADAHAAHRIARKGRAVLKDRVARKDRTEHRRHDAERAKKEPFGNLPKGPLQIVISINQQRLHLYGDGVHVADATIATGVPAHPTPMGIFSVIDKERFHRSNIYSGAPMPFMQRITWSGVAMHQGIGLGHPASHGCIRMPADFAAHLFTLHSLGARVVIARPELKPVEFADPHLFVHKVNPPPPVPTATAPAAGETAPTAASVDGKKIAAAAGSTATRLASLGQTDASAITAAAPSEHAADNDPAPVDPPAPPAPQAPTAAATSDPPAAAAPAPHTATVAAIGPAAAADATSPAQSGTAVGNPTKVASLEAEAAAPPIAAGVPAVPLPPAAPPAVSESTKNKPISIFISRRTSKIYVRQNFAPVLQAPVTIKDPSRPLGNHVFTALNYLADGSTFRWNVISLPAERPKANRNEEERKAERDGRHRRRHERIAAPAIELPPADTAADALARIEIPKDVIDQISALIIPGSSLIISDQGLGDETGEGTGFIVVTR